jgi:hypothetical protein
MKEQTSRHQFMADDNIVKRDGRHLRKIGQACESHLQQQ